MMLRLLSAQEPGSGSHLQARQPAFTGGNCPAPPQSRSPLLKARIHRPNALSKDGRKDNQYTFLIPPSQAYIRTGISPQGR